MANKKLREDEGAPITLYRGYKRSFDRWDDVNSPFSLDKNGEVDFADTPDIAAGYGQFGLRIVAEGLSLKEVSGYSVSDRDDILSQGFDGVKHSNQYYIFNCDKLNKSIIRKNAFTIAGTDTGLCLESNPPKGNVSIVHKDDLVYVPGEIMNTAWARTGSARALFSDSEFILCKAKGDQGNSSVQVYSTECADLYNRSNTYCTCRVDDLRPYSRFNESLNKTNKLTLNEVKYPEGDDIGYRLKFYTDTDGYNLDHEDGDWVSFDAALNNVLDEIKSFKKYGTDIELIEIVKIITDEEDEYMEEEELLRSIPYDHKKYGWKVMSNLPSKSHTSYVIHQIMDWGRDYTDSDTFRSIKKIADACEKYDSEYTADEYEFVIRNAGLLSKATKNSRYRWNESMKKEANKLTLNEDLFESFGRPDSWNNESDNDFIVDLGDRDDVCVSFEDAVKSADRNNVDVITEQPPYSNKVIRKWVRDVDGRFKLSAHDESLKEDNESRIIRITDIDWDTDGEDVDLPTEVKISMNTVKDWMMRLNHYTDEEVISELDEDIADYLSNKYGWLVNGFYYDERNVLNKIKKLGVFIFDESLDEDLFLAPQEPSDETPATAEANGVAKLILDAINDESDTIKMYNDLIANTDNEDIIKIIQDITAEENNHLGMLQKALEIVSPNASNIEDGVEEAESMISDDASTADPEFVPLDDLFNDEEQHWPINESTTVDISQFKPNSKIIAKLQDYYDRRSKINVRAIKGYPKALTYLYCMELFLNDIRNFTPTSDTSWEQKLELKKNKSYLEDMIWQLDDKAEELDVPREVIDDVIYEAQNDSTTLKPVTESLREAFNGNIIHIISDVDQIYPDGWDFPIEEVDYLLSEHPGETFVLAKDDSGKFRFWGTSNSQTESLGEDLHSNFKKEIKDAYKKWASEVEEVEKLRKDAMDMIPEGATDEQINKYSDFINDMYPLPNKFNYEFPHNIEKDDYPFYVTFYAEYPIYEPAEGGYYYAGADAIWSQGFDTKEDAQLYADAYVKNEKADFNEPWEQYADGYTLRGEYIGEDQRVVIEPRNAYLHGIKGWEPYQ